MPSAIKSSILIFGFIKLHLMNNDNFKEMLAKAAKAAEERRKKQEQREQQEQQEIGPSSPSLPILQPPIETSEELKKCRMYLAKYKEKLASIDEKLVSEVDADIELSGMTEDEKQSKFRELLEKSISGKGLDPMEQKLYDTLDAYVTTQESKKKNKKFYDWIEENREKNKEALDKVYANLEKLPGNGFTRKLNAYKEKKKLGPRIFSYEFNMFSDSIPKKETYGISPEDFYRAYFGFLPDRFEGSDAEKNLDKALDVFDKFNKMQNGPLRALLFGRRKRRSYRTKRAPKKRKSRRNLRLGRRSSRRSRTQRRRRSQKNSIFSL